jgi:hypothetical protein
MEKLMSIMACFGKIFMLLSFFSYSELTANKPFIEREFITEIQART